MDELDLGSTLKGFVAGQKVFGRYTLRRILGRGGMGVVWLAQDESLDREVALKFLPEVVAADPRAVDDLKRETRRSLKLTHPHIVRIYDFIEDARTAAIAMEFVAGETLSKRALAQPERVFSAAELMPWVEQLCAALDYAHTKAQVVHRDLKPANLMLDERGDLKVADFGIAASVSDSVSRVSAQAGSSGTPVYMSPQQMMGERPAATDDIYALGATLYELLTGKPPFYTGNILLQVQSKVPPSIAARREELGVGAGSVPSHWEETIAACLAKEPKDRPQSVAEVASRLGSTPTVTASAPPAAPPVPKPAVVSAAPAAAPARKSMLPVAAVGAVILVAAGVAGWWFGVRVPEQRRLEETRIAVEQARITAEQKRLADEAAERARRAEAARLAALRVPVTLRTSPSGAEIFVNGDSRGIAPVVGVPLPLGEHQVVARLAGHEDREQTITVAESGQTEWTLPLAATTGVLEVDGRPAGASYELYAFDEGGARREPSVRRGTLPITALVLAPGRYELAVRSPEAGADIVQRESFEIRRGETRRVDVDVRGVSLRISSVPAGAAVTVDGVAAGVTPLQLPPAPAGSVRRVELSLPGYRSLTREFQLTEVGRPVSWEAVLEGLPRVSLRGIFGRGADRYELTATTNYSYSGDVESLGTRTPIQSGPHGTAAKMEIRDLSYGADGELRGYTGVHPKEPISSIYTAEGGAWTGRFSSGMRIEYGNSPLPLSWLDHAAIPDGVPSVGQSWDVPTASRLARSMTTSRLDGPTGTIRARVLATQPYGPDAWAEVEYAFDLRGNYSRQVSDEYVTTGDAQVTGTAVLRLELAAKYVSRARVRETVRSTERNKVRRSGSVLSTTQTTTEWDRELVAAPLAPGASPTKSSSTGPAPTVAPPEVKSGAAAQVGPEPGEKWTVPGLGLELLPVAPGTYTMGATGKTDTDTPLTRVTLTREFWLGRTEVTQTQWQALMKDNPSEFQGANRPVEKVSWIEAMDFCRKLTERERDAGRLPDGYAYTLPTEAQWEYACRAGTTGDFAGDLGAMGWYDRNSDRETKPVGQKHANAWGLHDMHGNVWEWCLDPGGRHPGGAVTDPLRVSSSEDRVYRGGSWRNPADDCRSASRWWHGAGRRYSSVGFRVALTKPHPTVPR